MNLQEGKLYKFKGKIHYGQDMQQYHRELPDIIFQCTGKCSDSYRFVADGFGCLKNGEYGNGAIYVWGESIDKKYIKEIKIKPLRK